MSAFVIVELTVTDPAQMDAYRALAIPVITQHGGRIAARSAEPLQLEGDRPDREQMIVIEFPSAEAARRWYESDDYAPALAVRDRAMTRRMTLLGG